MIFSDLLISIIIKYKILGVGKSSWRFYLKFILYWNNFYIQTISM